MILIGTLLSFNVFSEDMLLWKVTHVETREDRHESSAECDVWRALNDSLNTFDLRCKQSKGKLNVENLIHETYCIEYGEAEECETFLGLAEATYECLN